MGAAKLLALAQRRIHEMQRGWSIGLRLRKSVYILPPARASKIPTVTKPSPSWPPLYLQLSCYRTACSVPCQAHKKALLAKDEQRLKGAWSWYHLLFARALRQRASSSANTL